MDFITFVMLQGQNTTIDWQKIVDIVTNITIAGAAVITAVYGSKGLASWRAQLTGRIEYDIARTLLKQTYVLENEIFSSRAPMITANEFPDDFPFLDGASKEPEEYARGFAYVYNNRLKPVFSAYRELQATSFDAASVWGTEIFQKVEDFHKVILWLYASMDVDVMNKQSKGENFRSDPAYGKRVQADIFRSSEGNDSLSVSLKAAVKGIEEAVKPHLEAFHTRK